MQKHPGLLKGLSPDPDDKVASPPSPSAEEAKVDLQQQAKEKQEAASVKTQRREAVYVHVAAEEDRLRREDIDRRHNVKHPTTAKYAPVPASINKNKSSEKDGQ